MKYKETNSKDEMKINKSEYFEFRLGSKILTNEMCSDIHEYCENCNQQRINSKYEGFTLLEVLIALIILTFGILSLAKLQTISLIQNYNAYLYSVASEQIASIFERAKLGVADKELLAWQKTIALLLPQGQGKYYDNIKDISVCWHDRLSYTVECLRDQ